MRDGRREAWRRTDDPSAARLIGLSGEGDGRGHGAIRDIVVPAIVVGECGQGRADGRARTAKTPQNEETPGAVRLYFPERDRAAEELSGIEKRLAARADGAGSRSDHERTAVGNRGIPQRTGRMADALKSVEGGFLVGELDGPGDGGGGRRDFAHEGAVLPAENAKAGGLASHTALGVLVAIGNNDGARNLRAD